MNRQTYDFYRLNTVSEIISAFLQLSDSSFSHSILRQLNSQDFTDYANKLEKHANFYVIGNKNISDFSASKDLVFGCVAFYSNDKDTRHAFISLIVICKGKQGEGFGRKLVELAINSAVESGMQTLGVNVHKENNEARKFYEKMGFGIVSDYDSEHYNLIRPCL